MDKVITLQDHSSGVKFLSFSPDGKTIVSCCRDRTIKFQSLENCKEITSFLDDNFVNSVCFSPDEKIIASCSLDNTIKLWDLEKGEEFMTL